LSEFASDFAPRTTL